MSANIDATPPTAYLNEPVSLAGLTRRKLQEFRQRRHWLIFWRSSSLVLVVMVAALLVAITIDAVSAHWAARWIGSAVIYAALIGALGWMGFDFRARKSDLRSDARRIERLVPRLRHCLLSAVELGDADSTVMDSTAFRARLQQDVADLLDDIDIPQLLPWSRAQRRVRRACLALVSLAVLGIVPPLHFPQRMARVLFPAADVGRVSRIAISIERPAPASKTVPSHDIVPITARVDGPTPESLMLELRTTNGYQQPIVMSLLPEAADSQVRFEALFTMTDEAVEYRITGAHASTAWYQLEPKSRPQIIAFTKRITPPAYADSKTCSHSDRDGNIEVLAGSRVELSLKIDQPTKIHQLQWQDDHPPLNLQLDPTSGERIGDFLADSSSAFKVHLQSLETGFVNTFSPSYHVTVHADQPPEITWLRKDHASTLASTLVSTQQRLPLAWTCSDELPLASLEASVRVNDSDWTTVAQLPIESFELGIEHRRRTVEQSWQLDLLSHNLQAGDQLEVKLRATDRKGQMAESSVFSVNLSPIALAATGTPAATLRQELVDSLQELERKVSAAKREFDSLSKLSPDTSRAAQLAQLHQFLIAMMAEFQQSLRHSLKLTERAAAEPGDMANSHALVDVGGNLAILSTMASDITLGANSLLSADNDELQRNGSALRDSLAAAVVRTQELSAQVQVLTTLDILTLHAQRFRQLADAERELAKIGNAASSSPAQLDRRQAVLTQQLREAYQAFMDAIPLIRTGSQTSHHRNAALLSQQLDLAERLKRFSAQEGGVTRVAQSAVQLLSRLSQPAQLDASLLGNLRTAEHRLAEVAADATRPLEQMVNELPHPLPTDIAAERASQQLSNRRTVERSAANGDRRFAADLGTSQRAIEKIANLSQTSAQNHTTAFGAVAEALATLQAVHSVEQIDDLLSELLKTERWPDDNAQLSKSPRLWQSLASRFEIATKLLQKAKLPGAFIDQLQQAAQSAAFNNTGSEMSGRLAGNAVSARTLHELASIQASLASLRQQLAAQATLARAKLQQYAPTVAELARQAAKKTRELREHSQQLAESTQRDEIPDFHLRLAQLEEQQQTLQQPLNSLRDSLVDRAEAQNLLDQQQLQMAQRADAAREIVESVEQSLQLSLADVPIQAPAATQAQALHDAAERQARSASTLEQLADSFEGANMQLDLLPDTNPSVHPDGEIEDPSPSLARERERAGLRQAEIQSKYQRAEELARLAAQDPQSVLRQLEEELPTNAPMASEMSHIARQAAQRALRELEEVASGQAQLAQDLETADPRFTAQKQLLVHDLQMIHQEAQHMLTTVGQEAKWTAGASRSDSLEQRIASANQDLQTALEATREVDMQLPFAQLRSLSTELERQLQTAADELLATGQELSKHSFEEIHQNGADLNNRRRELRDRQRRIQQQSVRDAQHIERGQQQNLRQTEEGLLRSEQRLKQIEAGSLTAREPSDMDSPRTNAEVTEATRQRELALAQASVEANQELQRALQSRVEAAQAALQSANQREPSPLVSVNPAAELSANLAKQAAESSRSLSQRLKLWELPEYEAIHAAAQHLQTDDARQSDLRDTVEQAADGLARAARHENRLDKPLVGQQLQQIADATQVVADRELLQASAEIAAAMQDALGNGSRTGQASAAATAAARAAIEAGVAPVNAVAQRVRELLAEPHDSPTAADAPTAQSASPPPTPATLDAQQKAQLLDELDRQMTEELKLGPPEDNSQPAPTQGEPAQQTTPATLTDAAQQLAKSMSQSRQPPAEASSNPDLGMATESQMADVTPQPPVPVRLIEVPRGHGSWGQLREQAADTLHETARQTFSPRFRQQIEAYFRELSERGRPHE